MASTSEFSVVGIVVFSLAGVVFAFALVVWMGQLFGPPGGAASPRWLIGLFLLLMITLWGAGLSVFLFEGLGGLLFKTREAQNTAQAAYLIAGAVLGLIVFLRTFVLVIQGVRENPSNIAGGAVILLLIAAAYLVADLFFDLPFFDLIDPNPGAVQ